MRVALVFLAVISLAGLARADAPDVGVVVSGGTPQLKPHVQDWVRTHGYALVGTPLGKDATITFDNCFVLEDIKCARGVFDARSRSASLIYVGVDEDAVSIYWFVKDREQTGGKFPCAGCDVTALVDGELAKLAKTQTALPVTKRPPKPSKFWPSVLLGTGVVSVAAGGVFLYYGLGISGADEKFIYPDSTPLGIALAAVGGGATIGGIILLSGTSSSSSGPVASVSPGGGFVGWAGHF
jgi:hypothetical protein